jgi:hypothetical protein
MTTASNPLATKEKDGAFTPRLFQIKALVVAGVARLAWRKNCLRS